MFHLFCGLVRHWDWDWDVLGVFLKHAWNGIKCLNAFIQTFYIYCFTFSKTRVLNACGERGDGSCDHHGGSCGECDSEPFDCYNIHQEKNFLNALTIQLFILSKLVDAFCRNIIAHDINGIFGHNNVFRFHLVNLCNCAGVLIFTLN